MGETTTVTEESEETQFARLGSQQGITMSDNQNAPSYKPDMLTLEEIEDLRKDLREASAWMQEELDKKKSENKEESLVRNDESFSSKQLPLMLTLEEIEDLRKDLREASAWAKQEIKKRNINIRRDKKYKK